jgi:hypothetical protein
MLGEGMSVQTQETASAQQTLATAYAYSAQQQQAQAELVATALAVWATLDMKNAVESWVAGVGQKIYVLLSILQQLMANDANAYVRRVLAGQGVPYTGPMINPGNFSGIASDGRDLESLLAGAVVQVRKVQHEGLSDEEAARRGANWLRMTLMTQTSDQARAAESVSLTVANPEVTVGWVRMLTPPSCGRCAVLAGRFYKWSDGFERHPMCDCRHIPCTVAGSDDLTTDPMVYFNSLSTQQQDDLFGKAQAQAIRDGADISQVVNASARPGAMFTADNGRRYTREGATKRGLFGQTGPKGRVLRPTPLQIYRDAKGDKDVAIEMLRRFRYVL